MKELIRLPYEAPTTLCRTLQMESDICVGSTNTDVTDNTIQIQANDHQVGEEFSINTWE